MFLMPIQLQTVEEEAFISVTYTAQCSEIRSLHIPVLQVEVRVKDQP